jgi:ketosteroid isomerase-like protein
MHLVACSRRPAVTVPQHDRRVAHWTDGRPIGPPQPAPKETPMLTVEKTADYVKRWVAAFESKDLDRVLAFYTDDVIFHSPLVARLSHDPSGTVQGKAALRAYVKKGFEVFDHIRFTVLDVLRGVDSIAIHYKGITGTHVVEVLFFDKDGLVRESYVHYASPEQH